MGLEQYSKEQLKEMSLIELAYESLLDKKQAVPFKEILDEIVAAVNLPESEVRARIAQFYTDLNIDGRFLCLGDNRWGIRDWYPVEQSEEDTITPIKPKKKKAKKALDEDDLEDYEDLDEDLEYDDFVEEDEEDDLLDDEDDLVEDDEDLLADDEEIIEEEEEFDIVEDEDDLEDDLEEELEDEEEEL